jgi:hypothetical protein
MLSVRLRRRDRLKNDSSRLQLEIAECVRDQNAEADRINELTKYCDQLREEIQQIEHIDEFERGINFEIDFEIDRLVRDIGVNASKLHQAYRSKAYEHEIK